MANVSSSNGIEKYPKLRFPEFTEPWSHIKLSDFAERIMRKNKNNETDLPLTISSKDGLVDQISFFNKTVASKDMSGYYLLMNGEYAYNKSYSVGYDFGSIKRLERYPRGALSTLYICFALKKYNSDFIKSYFDSLKWYKEIYMISAEGARNHGLLNIPTDEFFDTFHYITENKVEQEKIAKLMEFIEQRIRKQQALVDNLKKYKRGVIQAVFDDEKRDLFGEISSGKQVKLSDLMDFQNGINADASKYGRGIRYISVSDILKNNFITYDKIIGQVDIDSRALATYSVTYGDVLFQRSSETREDAGRSNVYLDAEKTATFGGFVIRGKKKSDYDPLYLKYALDSFAVRKQIMQCAAGAQHINVSQEDLCNVVVNLPTIDVQTRISKFISDIDLRITIEEKKTTAQVTLKKALLQQLFI